ncbi:hypothetical protein ES707_11346 [subsurface metagenome]
MPDKPENKQDNPEAKQDNPPGPSVEPEEPSAEKKEPSAKEPPRTYTEEEYQGALSNELAKKGRTDTILNKRKEDLDKRAEALTEKETVAKKKSEKEEAAAISAAEEAGDKPLVSALTVQKQNRLDRQKVDDDKAELETSKAAHAEEIRESEQIRLEVFVWRAAQGVKVNPTKLMAQCKDLELSIADKDKIQKVAQNMAAEEPPPTLQPDPSLTLGGSDPEEQAKLKKLYPTMFQ